MWRHTNTPHGAHTTWRTRHMAHTCAGGSIYVCVLRLKFPDGHVDTSRALHEDQTIGILWYFFFTCDVEKSQLSIFDQIDAIST